MVKYLSHSFNDGSPHSRGKPLSLSRGYICGRLVILKHNLWLQQPLNSLFGTQHFIEMGVFKLELDLTQELRYPSGFCLYRDYVSFQTQSGLYSKDFQVYCQQASFIIWGLRIKFSILNSCMHILIFYADNIIEIITRT